ncbi:MAG: phage tail protein [Clostridiales bacterium]
MSTPYVGEIRMFAGNFPPSGWMFCEGQLLAISEYDTLFNLIGTTYGGDGQNTFALPDLRGRIPIHMGSGPDGTSYTIGEMGGVESVTLTMAQIPSHNHAQPTGTGQISIACTTDAGNTDNPNGVYPSKDTTGDMMYSESTDNSEMVYPGTTGGSQTHENLPPCLALNFIISLFGIYPSPT